MVRPREFEEAEVLERAMRTFWANGYERTTLDDLLSCTELSKSSLYGAFGDKRQLFLRSLERYAQVQQSIALDTWAAAGEVRAKLRGFLRHVAEDSSQLGSMGCMMVNAIAELASADSEVLRISRANALALEKGLTAELKRAQMNGEIPAAIVPRDFAAFVIGMVAGIRIQGRSGTPKESLLRQIDIALSPIAPPPVARGS
jgi:TetR/AcrR family transcriptional regulator, transcriptional repressor for nem operon